MSRIVDPAPVDEKYVKHAVLVGGMMIINLLAINLTSRSQVATSAFQMWCDKKLLLAIEHYQQYQCFCETFSENCMTFPRART